MQNNFNKRGMQTNLVIVESPAKAKTIEKFLGKDFVVKSSYGHIRDLRDNKLSVDIENNFTPEYIIPEEKKKLVSELKKAAAKADIIWLASDEDREGEAISWHLCEALGLDINNTRRIVFHEITKDAILRAVENPRELDLKLVNAQQARRVLDRLVGFELSPVLWKKIQRGLSAGRVQSVALRLIVDREKEIMAFQNSSYYKVEASFDAEGIKVKGTLNTQFESLEQARAFLEDSVGASYHIADIEKKEATKHSAAPFTTSTLQQEAARKLKMSVSATMRAAQNLYERGLITYMRTDSTNLSSLAIGTAKEFIINNFGEEYSHPSQYKTKSKGAQEAHEAIRPTYISNTEIEGTPQEKRLYKLIWKRTLASQMAAAKVLNTSISVASNKRSEVYEIKASEILFDGFLKLYMEGKDDEEITDEEVILPTLNCGQALDIVQINAENKFTTPPHRFSEGTLVKKLEELGIGRPSTYQPTITTLTKARGYVMIDDKPGKNVNCTHLILKNGTITQEQKVEVIGAEKKKLVPAEIGMVVTDYLVENFPNIINYDFTANVEKDFDDIAEGNKEWRSVISDFYGDFHESVNTRLNDKQFNHVEKVLGVDPVDGSTIIARFGQYGAYVQKGEGDNKQSASLASGQLIDSITLEEALDLFKLPRTVGIIDGVEVIATKGRFGPYLKYGDKSISIPKGTDPLSITLDACKTLISAHASANAVIKEFKDSDISILNGRYGPYIKHAGANYKIAKGTDIQSLSEEDCKSIISAGSPTTPKYKKRSKK